MSAGPDAPAQEVAVTNPAVSHAPASTAARSVSRTPSKFRLAVLFTAPLFIPAAAWGGSAAYYFHAVADQPPAPPPPETDPVGSVVFAKNCAYCHGAKGDGNGTTLLIPHARYFGGEKYKFASTTNGVPTDDDLLNVLHRGIPGSAMPAFPQLTDVEKRAVVDHLRTLTRAGTFDRLFKSAAKDGDDPDVADIGRRIDGLTTSGPKLEIPATFPDPTPEILARGGATFLKVCAGCHGPAGKGDGPQVKDMRNEDEFGSPNKGVPNKPRDLTLGVFKAGGDPAHIYTRIMLGIPGTPMPSSANALKPHEVQELVRYVLSLQTPNKN